MKGARVFKTEKNEHLDPDLSEAFENYSATLLTLQQDFRAITPGIALLSLTKKMRDARPNNPRLVEKYKNIASQMGIINRVHFIGALPRDRIIQYYNDAHVFVLPSYNEGMSNAILEAMAAGLPILTTKNCSDELVQHKVNGYLFQWQDTSKLTSYLKALIKNHSLINSMGQSSSQIAQTLRWNKVAKQYNTLFKRYDTV